MSPAVVLWLMLYCADDCRAGVHIEVHKHKTECEQSRTELLDKGQQANRWVFARCVEQPMNGHFNYLEEGTEGKHK